jgi:hypothetical protein
MSLGGLAIHEPCVILADSIRGTRDFIKGTKGGDPADTGKADNHREIAEVPKFQRRAAKVERAACAIGDMFSVAGFHLCMYSTDTLHPSP